MKKFLNKLALIQNLHHLLVAKALVVPLLLFVPHKAEAAVPIIAGLFGLLGAGLKGLAEGATEAAASLATLALSVGILSYIAFSLAKFMLWLAATAFNWAMETMVFGFSTVFGTSDGMLLAWSTLRDVGNIVLLFGFLYIGIQAILNVAHFNAKQTLPRLLIAAILINFSLFISGAIIDLTNGISSTFDSERIDGTCQGTGDGDEESCRLNNGVAGQILSQLNIISVVSGVSGIGGENVDVIGDAQTYFSNPVSSTITFIALAFLVMLAAIVLFAGALLIITRGITLAFLLVVSPIGFVGMAIEPMHKISERWWKALIDNALFAPIFIILLFVGLRLTDGLKNSVQVEGGLVTALTSGDGLMAGPVFLFMLVIGFMIAALTFARSAGVIGSEAAVKFATSIGTSTGTFPFLPLRNFVSEKSDKYRKAYESRVAGSIRKIPFVGKDIETMVGAGVSKTFEAGKNISLPGWGTKPGWDEQVKKRGAHLRHEEHMAHLAHEFDDAVASYATDPGKMKKFLGENSIKDLKSLELLGKKDSKHLGMLAENMSADKFKEFMKDQEIPEEVQKRAETIRTESYQKKLDSALAKHASGNSADLTQFMKDTNGYDLKNLSQMKSGGRGIEQMVSVMPVDQFKQFVADKDVPAEVKKQMRTARFGKIPSTLEGAARGNASAKSDLAKVSGADIAMSGVLNDRKGREEAALTLANKQFDQALQGDLSEAAKFDLRSLRDDVVPGGRFDPTPNPARGTSNAKETIDSLSSSEVADLRPSTLTHRDILPLLSPRDFWGVAKADKLGKNDKQKVVSEVRSIRANPSDGRHDELNRYYKLLTPEQKAAFDQYYL